MDSDPGAAAIAAQILLLIALTMMNAFFAGAEMAVVSVNKNKIRMLADNGNKKAALIQKLSENSTGFLSTIQVAITFADFFPVHPRRPVFHRYWETAWRSQEFPTARA